MSKRTWTAGLVGAAMCGLMAIGVAVSVGEQPPAKGADPVPAAEWKVFTKSVVPLPEESPEPVHGRTVAKATAVTATKSVDFTVHLSIPEAAQKELADRVSKGEVLTGKEIDEKYSPKAEDVEKLKKWLEDDAQGLTVVGQAKDRSSVYVRGTVPKIEKALRVQFVLVKQDGVTYTAVRNAPGLPTAVGQHVSAILGLQPFLKATKNLVRVPLEKGTRAKGRKDNTTTGEVPPVVNSPDEPNKPPYIVPEILKAYNADNAGVTGAGQTIAILIDTFPNKSDLDAFWLRNNLHRTAKVEMVNVNNALLPPASGEETLDAEWSAGIAPGATVRVYASGSLGWDELNRALDRIAADLDTTPGLRQLSISLGIGEAFNRNNDVMLVQNEKFKMLAARGVNIFVSSGDAGSNPAGDGHSRGNERTAEFGASSPWVVGVGGTNLFLGNNGQVSSETGWEDSGGGPSERFDRPAWQKGPGIPVGVHRLVPDVALVASGDTPAFVILNGAEVGFGGTSWSAPVWAGFSALLNESRVKAGKDANGFLNPRLYSMSAADKAKAFRDITVGNNSGSSSGQFPCGPGYDMVTGLGVPNVKGLMTVLNADVVQPPANTTVELQQADFTPAGWKKLYEKAPGVMGLKLEFAGDAIKGTVVK